MKYKSWNKENQLERNASEQITNNKKVKREEKRKMHQIFIEVKPNQFILEKDAL